jgi:hypothetical protein
MCLSLKKATFDLKEVPFNSFFKNKLVIHAICVSPRSDQSYNIGFIMIYIL